MATASRRMGHRWLAFARLPTQNRVGGALWLGRGGKGPSAARRFHVQQEVKAATGGTNVQLSDAEMARRLMRSQRVWWWLGGVALAGVTLVAFAPELKVGVSKHTAEVASRSLQDETLQSNTRELASQIVQTVLNDPKVLDQASQFLQRLVVMDATRDALRSLVIHTLNDKQTLAQVATLTKQTLALLIEDPKTLRQLVDLLSALTIDPQAKQSLLLLLEQLMKDEQTRRNLTQLLAFTFLQDPVKSSVTRTLGDSVHDVLSRADVENHAKEFVGNVVRDQTVRAQSGDAIWSSVMYAITPSFLSWIWQADKGTSNKEAVTEAEAIAVETIAAVEEQTQKKLHQQESSSVEDEKKSSADAATSQSTLARKESRSLGSASKDSQPAEKLSRKQTTSKDLTRRQTSKPRVRRQQTGSPKSSDAPKTESMARPARGEFTDLHDDGEHHLHSSGSGFL